MMRLLFGYMFLAWGRLGSIGLRSAGNRWFGGRLIQGGPAGGLDVKVDEMSMEVFPGESNVEAEQEGFRTGFEE